jgi:hypothetical protein
VSRETIDIGFIKCWRGLLKYPRGNRFSPSQSRGSLPAFADEANNTAADRIDKALIIAVLCIVGIDECRGRGWKRESKLEIYPTMTKSAKKMKGTKTGMNTTATHHTAPHLAKKRGGHVEMRHKPNEVPSTLDSQ